MKLEPLKDKGRYFEGQILRIPSYSCNPNQIFREEDIKSAVEWLLEKTYIRVRADKIDSKYYLNADEVRETIKEAFEDVIKK